MALQILRIAALLFIGSIAVVFISLAVGHRIETSIITEYAQINDVVYTVRVRDLHTNTFTELAGKRCFPPLPLESEWLTLRQQYQPNYIQQIQVRSFDAENAMSLLQCPSHP